jgi:hypothetical protein
MFRNNFGVPTTKAILSAAMLCLLNLPLQAEAQQWTSQAPAMTYTSSVASYTATEAAPISFASPHVIRTQPRYNSAPAYNTQAVYNSPAASGQSCQPGLAQSKAARAAQMGLRGHLGGGLGGAKYEGVGWSNQSPQDAIEHCCYWGTRPTAQIGVSKGRDGCWYACVLYY